MILDSSEIKNLEAEAGVIATLIQHPDYVLLADNLDSRMFSNMDNAMVFWAISKIVNLGGTVIDALSLTNALNTTKASREYAQTTLTVPALNDLIETSRLIARDTTEDFLVLVNGVRNAAFRREAYDKLEACQRMCFSNEAEDIQQKIYTTLDDVMLRFSSKSEIPPMTEVADSLWAEVCAHQGASGYPFKFPTLNKFVTIERGELVVICGSQKSGKSMLLLNEAVDLLSQGLRVLYIDSELSSRMFMCRLMAHLTGIEFRRVREGTYTDEEKHRIDLALSWLRQMPFTHTYMPIFDPDGIYTTVKKVSHTTGVDVVIIDYFKASDSTDAYTNYSELGNLVDLVKNKIAGDMDIAALGACQLTSNGKIADSAKIARNASTIILLQDKTPDEVANDGYDCGNKKFHVQFNRNGAQMMDDEYIDLRFIGNHVMYEEAQQHIAIDPY